MDPSGRQSSKGPLITEEFAVVFGVFNLFGAERIMATNEIALGYSVVQWTLVGSLFVVISVLGSIVAVVVVVVITSKQCILKSDGYIHYIWKA